jgi:hypothetical protein
MHAQFARARGMHHVTRSTDRSLFRHRRHHSQFQIVNKQLDDNAISGNVLTGGLTGVLTGGYSRIPEIERHEGYIREQKQARSV